jgi:hypothetical protein
MTGTNSSPKLYERRMTDARERLENWPKKVPVETRTRTKSVSMKEPNSETSNGCRLTRMVETSLHHQQPRPKRPRMHSARHIFTASGLKRLLFDYAHQFSSHRRRYVAYRSLLSKPDVYELFVRRFQGLRGHIDRRVFFYCFYILPALSARAWVFMLCWNIEREVFRQGRRHVCLAGPRVCSFLYAIRIGAQWVVKQRGQCFLVPKNMAV